MDDAQFDYDHATSNEDFDRYLPILTEATERYNEAVERFNDALEAEIDTIAAEGIASGEFDTADAAFNGSDYDPFITYNTYEDWDVPTDYDNFFSYTAPIYDNQSACTGGEVWDYVSQECKTCQVLKPPSSGTDYAIFIAET
jgi:hypothetical protein